MEIFTKNARETQRAGEELADSLKGGEIIALSGNLGSGKTTFIQGLAKGLGIKQRIISPTFILLREYKQSLPLRGKSIRVKEYKNFYHIDLYRLEKNVEDELRNLGIEEIWGKRENIVALEWAEKVKELLPKRAIWIFFESLGESERRITIK